MNNELKQWFTNIINRVENDKILFIYIDYKNSKNTKMNLDNFETFKEFYLKNEFNIRKYIHIRFPYDNKDTFEDSSLVYLNNLNELKDIYVLDKDMICLSCDQFLFEFEKFISNIVKNKDYIDKYVEDMFFEEFTYKEIKKINILKEIKESSINNLNIKSIIEDRQDVLNSILGLKLRFAEVIMKENYKLGHFELIQHIHILKNKNILTANLAHYLYRIFMLDFTSSKTRVGLNISKELNVKSKTFILDTLIKNTPRMRYQIKSLKAYDLNQRVDIKRQIAKNILEWDKETMFDIQTIAKLTELTESEVLEIKEHHLNYIKP